VNLTSRVSHSSTARPRAADVLGTQHPLVRTLARLDIARDQFVIVAALAAGGVGMLVAHFAAAIGLIIAAAAVELVIGCRIAALRESRRLCALDLIAQGRAELPIAAIERTCALLRATRQRQQLARAVDTLLDPRPRAFDVVVTPWQFAPSELVVAVREELWEISQLLREPDAGVAGIAMMELLLCDGTSQLHGDDPRVLREELGRVRFLLKAGSVDRNAAGGSR
jgi:hypothetical protein